MTHFRSALAATLRAWAKARRDGWADHVARWEADTEPGYPLPPMNAAARELGLSIANVQDALADSIDPAQRQSSGVESWP